MYAPGFLWDWFKNMLATLAGLQGLQEQADPGWLDCELAMLSLLEWEREARNLVLWQVQEI